MVVSSRCGNEEIIDRGRRGEKGIASANVTSLSDSLRPGKRTWLTTGVTVAIDLTFQGCVRAFSTFLGLFSAIWKLQQAQQAKSRLWNWLGGRLGFSFPIGYLKAHVKYRVDTFVVRYTWAPHFNRDHVAYYQKLSKAGLE